MIRWGSRWPASRAGGPPDATIEVALVAGPRPAQRKRIRVNGVPRRAQACSGVLRVVLFAPEEMLLVAGFPVAAAVRDGPAAGQRSAAYLRDLATYGRALQQRNGLLRAIREEQAARDELRFWDEASRVRRRDGRRALRLLRHWPNRWRRPTRRSRPRRRAGPPACAMRRTPRRAVIATGRPRAAPAETAEKESGTEHARRAASRRRGLRAGRPRPGRLCVAGQQRTAILAYKLAELALLTELDGRPPLLLLDDVFSELDPARRGHLVRRIAELPQAFVTTTALEDLDAGPPTARHGVGGAEADARGRCRRRTGR